MEAYKYIQFVMPTHNDRKQKRCMFTEHVQQNANSAPQQTLRGHVDGLFS